jgi:hypothetical protein
MKGAPAIGDTVDSLVLGSKNYGINLNFLRNVDKKKKLNIPYCYQLIKKSGVDRLINGIRIVSADRFLCGLI